MLVREITGDGRCGDLRWMCGGREHDAELHVKKGKVLLVLTPGSSTGSSAAGSEWTYLGWILTSKFHSGEVEGKGHEAKTEAVVFVTVCYQLLGKNHEEQKLCIAIKAAKLTARRSWSWRDPTACCSHSCLLSKRRGCTWQGR